MISSEVQRTLVKSPPELWTELSDPESLARHLGELGEIKITRTEPENLVEWEADGTTGTVEIKPSGWGTKVTLTVLREVPQDAGEPDETAAADDPLAPEQAEAAEQAEATEVAESESVEMEVEATPTTSVAPGVEPAPPEIEEAPEFAVAEIAEIAPDVRPERTPGPATEAARRAAGLPSAGEEPAAAAGPEEPELGGLRAWALQSGTEAPLVLKDEVLDARAPQASPPPRRGFLARLFGRRRKERVETELDLADLDRDTAGLASAGEDVEAAVEAVGLDDPEPDAAEETRDDLFGAEGTTATTAEPAQKPELAPLAEEAAPGEAADQGEPSEETTSPPAAPAAYNEPHDGAGSPNPIAEPRPIPGQDDENDASPAPAPSDEDPAAAAAPAPAPDLGAELRAAEEAAAGEVEAVLTAVLDRLGSAHHRPFSRS